MDVTPYVCLIDLTYGPCGPCESVLSVLSVLIRANPCLSVLIRAYPCYPCLSVLIRAGVTSILPLALTQQS